MISILYDSGKYRDFLSKKIGKGSVVIEIGPHLGHATRRYMENAKLSVLVDKATQSRDAIKDLMEDHGNLRFVEGDARCFETVLKVRKLTGRCDFLAVDMGGGRYPDTVFKVWAVWSGVFKPKHSVIRNRGLAEFVQKAHVKDETLVRDFPDDGWMSLWGRAVPSRLKEQMGEFNFWVEPG